MTNYNKWDSKASALVKEADDEDEQAKAANDKALGLEGGPKGPPTAKAESELKDLGAHSEERKEFIDWSKKREVTQTHKPQDEPIVLEGPEVKDLAVRLSGSEGVTYIIPDGAGIIKLMFDKCKRIKVQLGCTLMTSTIEAFHCVDVSFELAVPVGTFQVDECKKEFSINFAELDHIGSIYHQNSPNLSIGYGGAGAKLEVVGQAIEAQYYTKRGLNGDSALITAPVRRGENEFPIDLPGDEAAVAAGYGEKYARDQPEPEAPPASEENRRKAEMKRQSGNEMFRANDYFQAAMEYTSALELDPTISALYGNRSQCWLKLGNHEKSLEDAIKCTEVDPANAKGWFRKGMSLHAMKNFREAIPALLEAEKLDPKNKQIPDAIKMAQLMARKQNA